MNDEGKSNNYFSNTDTNVSKICLKYYEFCKMMDKQLSEQDFMTSIIRQLKLLREEKDLSQELFYIDTGIHIGRIEAGRSNLTLITLKKICDYLDITPKDFFDRIYTKQTIISIDVKKVTHPKKPSKIIIPSEIHKKGR